MTDQYRKVVRIEYEPATPRRPAHAAVFLECGHMFRLLLPAPATGNSRYCSACTNAARISEKLKS